MNQVLPLRIVGTAAALPSRVVTTTELAAQIGLRPEVALKRTGVQTRHWLSGDETALTLGVQAAREAVGVAGLELSDIDTILNASGSQMQLIPDGAALLARELGLRGVSGYSLHGTCLSFLVALNHAGLLLASGQARRILIVTTESGSVALNSAQPESSLLIGDGAAAVVLERAGTEGQGIEAVRFETYPEGATHTQIRGGGSLLHPRDAAPEDLLFDMQGLRVLKLASEVLPGFLERLRAGLSHGLGDIDRVIPHQASQAGLDLMTRFGWPAEQIEVTLPALGNVVAASVPLTLHQALSRGHVGAGSRILLAGTGAGLIAGGLILKL